MTRAHLLDLAARVEAAKGADREMDAEIDRSIGTPGWRLSEAQRWFCNDMRRPPAFTASLDAAASLVPNGWRVNTADWSILGEYSWVLRGPCTKHVPGPDGYPEAGSDWFVYGRSLAGPALALTAAALRALAEDAE